MSLGECPTETIPVVKVGGTGRGAVEVAFSIDAYPAFEVDELARRNEVETPVDVASGSEDREDPVTEVSVVDEASVFENRGFYPAFGGEGLETSPSDSGVGPEVGQELFPLPA